MKGLICFLYKEALNFQGEDAIQYMQYMNMLYVMSLCELVECKFQLILERKYIKIEKVETILTHFLTWGWLTFDTDRSKSY